MCLHAERPEPSWARPMLAVPAGVPHRGRSGRSDQMQQCINIRFAACLPNGSRDCQRSEKLLITARRPAVMIGMGFVKLTTECAHNLLICAAVVRRFAGSPGRRVAGSPGRRVAGSPGRRVAGSPIQGYRVGPLPRRSGRHTLVHASSLPAVPHGASAGGDTPRSVRQHSVDAGAHGVRGPPLEFTRDG
jgi:hypothetical protein